MEKTGVPDQGQNQPDPYLALIVTGTEQVRPAIWGWMAATSVGLAVCAVGMGVLAGDPLAHAAVFVLFPIALLFTLPTLVVRCCVRFASGPVVAVCIGTLCGLFLLPATVGVFDPVAGRPEAVNWQDALVYGLAGASAGRAWWSVEKWLRA